MTPINFITLLLLSIILSGCQTTQGPIARDSPTQSPPPGSVIELHQSIPVYPGYSRSFIQFGKSVKANEMNRRYPWCQFRLYEPPQALQTERSIEADSFLVTQSNRRFEMVASTPQMLASSTLWFNMLDDDPSDQDLSSVMQIQSAKQPQVVEFKCSIFSEPQILNYVTINEMQQALGDLVTIQLP